MMPPVRRSARHAEAFKEHVMRIDRLIVALLLIALVIWRLIRYVRLGISGRPRALGLPGGVFLPSSGQAGADSESERPPSGRSPVRVRLIGASVSAVIWILGNLLIWTFLFGLPKLRDAPPVLLGVVGVFANFYLIPFARRTGSRCCE